MQPIYFFAVTSTAWRKRLTTWNGKWLLQGMEAADTEKCEKGD